MSQTDIIGCWKLEKGRNVVSELPYSRIHPGNTISYGNLNKLFSVL